MTNIKTLIPGQHPLSVAEQSKGGKASGRSRRLKKRGRELMLALLELREPDPRIIADLQALGVDPRDLTKEVALHLRQIEKAIRKGDTAAYREVLRVAGILEPDEVKVTHESGAQPINITLRDPAAVEGMERALATGAEPRKAEEA